MKIALILIISLAIAGCGSSHKQVKPVGGPFIQQGPYSSTNIERVEKLAKKYFYNDILEKCKVDSGYLISIYKKEIHSYSCSAKLSDSSHETIRGLWYHEEGTEEFAQKIPAYICQDGQRSEEYRSVGGQSCLP